jgi:hypothetical protein
MGCLGGRVTLHLKNARIVYIVFDEVFGGFVFTVFEEMGEVLNRRRGSLLGRGGARSQREGGGGRAGREEFSLFFAKHLDRRGDLVSGDSDRS